MMLGWDLLRWSVGVPDPFGYGACGLPGVVLLWLVWWRQVKSEVGIGLVGVLPLVEYPAAWLAQC